MKKFFLIGILAAIVCLAGLFLFFGYLKPNLAKPKNTPAATGFVGDVPIGYFDLRGQQKVLVDIKGFDFVPQHIMVSLGTEMIWRNDDRVFHSVNFDSQPTNQGSSVPDSHSLKTGELFIQVLNLPGTYKYHSNDNPETITGIIIVK